jgi:two-component system C4-dicarboxylate transport sensor histidine kinase DctB
MLAAMTAATDHPAQTIAAPSGVVAEPGHAGPRRGWVVLVAVTAALLLAATVAAGRLARRVALDDLRRTAETATALHVAALRSEIEKQRALPAVLARDPDLAQVLRGGGDPGARERYDAKLEDLARLSRAAVIYAMDTAGLTVVASNWREPTSFVGQNYAFRPYFRDAITTGGYEQFALGTVSNRPGLYLSRTVLDDRGIAGVVVVKLEFDAMEDDWAKGSGRTYVADHDGVVVVTDWPGWRFRTVAPLDDEVRRRVQAEFRVTEKDLQPLPLRRWQEAEDGDVLLVSGGGTDGPALHVTDAVPGTDWTLHMLAPVEPALGRAEWQARLTAGLGTLVAGIGAGLWLAGRNRQQQRARRQEAVRQELEQRVAERTSALSAANTLLESEIQERMRTEASLRQLGDELVQANKLATMGQIAASVAHEVNQPLAAIRTYADNAAVLIDRGRTGDARENLSTIASLTDRIGVITQELRGFARRASGVVETVSLRQAIDGSLLLLDHRVRRQAVRLAIALPPGPLPVQGELVRIEQVIVNLLQNALDALDGQQGGSILVEVRDDRQETILAVSDNGPGLPTDGATDVFAPFVTTKASGLGLGLAISRDILRDFGASITVGPAPGGGASFVVTFRRAESGAA